MLSVKIRHKINCVFVNIGEHFFRDGGKFSFSIPISRCTVAVHRAEVSLSADQWIAQRKVLGQTHHGIINSCVAMRMKFSENLSYDGGGFAELGRGAEPRVPHGIKNSPMDRFEPVSHIGKSARDNHTHRIIQIRLLHFIGQFLRLDVADILCII